MISSKLPDVGTSIFAIMSAHANQHGAINLAQGFPNFPIDNELVELVYHYMKKGKNQYAPMPGVSSLRESIRGKIHHFYGKDVNEEEEISVTAGATQALFTAISAFCSKGDEAIIFEPAYDSYAPAIRLNGATPVPYALKAPEFRIDWDAVGRLVSDRTKMIMINSPHNPSGSILGPTDLEALTQLTRGTDIVVVSDEVYEHLVFDGHTHESVFLHEELYQRSIVIFSFGKTLHNTGWKMGYAVAPEPLTREFRKVHQFNVFSVNSPVQYAVADYLKEYSRFESLSAFFQQKRDLLLHHLKDTAFKPLTCRGTYFLIADYSDLSGASDREFAKTMSRDMGVATIPLSPFYTEDPGQKVVRFCFAKTEEMLNEAGKLLKVAAVSD